MTSSESSYTITVKRAEAAPPLFLAGSFGESDWKLQEMEATRDGDGGYTFSRTVDATPGREYQYNVRSGEDGPWIYDEKQTFVVPSGPAARSGEASFAGQPLRLAPVLTEDRSSTPANVVAATAAEVADTAERIDKDAGNWGSDYTWAKDEPLKMPLFAHESFGAYEFAADDALDHHQIDRPLSPHRRQKGSKDYLAEEIDVNDPTIVSFPCERSSVMSTLRKIQSSVDSQPKFREVASPIAIESIDDSSMTSGSLSPRSPTSFGGREGRLSHSSKGRKRSTASLTSIAEIAEEPRPGEPPIQSPSAGKPRTTHLEPGEVFHLSHSPLSDDDGMIMRQKPKVTTTLDHV